MINKLNEKLNGKVAENEELAQYTTYKIGGRAKYYYAAESKDELGAAVKAALELKIEYLVIGRGSNILVSDKGYEGLVIRNQARNYKINGNVIIVEGGINLSSLSNIAKDNGLTGLEFACGIPGSLGGAVRGNAGAFGSEIKNVVSGVTIIDEYGNFDVKSNAECGFGYRDSVFKKNRQIIASCELRLEKSTSEKVSEKMKNILEQKKDRQEYKLPSAGCVFKNPKVNADDLVKNGLDPEKINQRGEIPAAYLIDRLGLKGLKIGNAAVSDVHANFILNLGKATAENIIMLIGIIKQKVRDNYGIQLQEEIQYIGF